MSEEELKRKNKLLREALQIERDKNELAQHQLQSARNRIRRLEEAGGELICYLSHRIKTEKDDPIWHTASIKWGKVKKEFQL